MVGDAPLPQPESRRQRTEPEARALRVHAGDREIAALYDVVRRSFSAKVGASGRVARAMHRRSFAMRFFEVISAPLALLAISCVEGRPEAIDAQRLDSWQTAADAARDERNGTGALLDAWFGCAMGDTWAGALDTPPHAWSPHNLDRCHAVGVVGGASAVRLAAMAPDAVLAVQTELRRRIATDDRMPLQEREAARALFRDGTAALEEMAEVHYAWILLERASKSSAVAKSRSESSSIAWLLSDDTTPEALAGARQNLAAVGSLEALLHLAASEPKSVSPERERALAWMIGLIGYVACASASFSVGSRP
jgi:hypothetical protein